MASTPIGSKQSPPPAHVLVVEDNDDGRESLCALLGLQGYRVTGTGTGNGALMLLGADHFDAMVLDLGLPDLDGATVMRAAQSLSHPPAVLVFTGYHRMQDQTDVAGCDAFVLKPELERLLAKLRALVAEGHARSHTRPAQKVGGGG